MKSPKSILQNRLFVPLLGCIVLACIAFISQSISQLQCFILAICLLLFALGYTLITKLLCPTIKKYISSFVSQKNVRSQLVMIRQAIGISLVCELVVFICIYGISFVLADILPWQEGTTLFMTSVRLTMIPIFICSEISIVRSFLIGRHKNLRLYDGLIYLLSILLLILITFLIEDVFVQTILYIIGVPLVLCVVYVVYFGLHYNQYAFFLLQARMQETRAIGRKKVRKILLFENFSNAIFELFVYIPFLVSFFLLKQYVDGDMYGQMMITIGLYILPITWIFIQLFNGKNTELSKKLKVTKKVETFEKQLLIALFIGLLPTVMIWELFTFTEFNNVIMRYGIVFGFLFGINYICAKYVWSLSYRFELFVYYLIGIATKCITCGFFMNHIGIEGSIISDIVMLLVFFFLVFVKIYNKKNLRIQRIGMIAIRICIASIGANGVLVLCKYGLTYMSDYRVIWYVIGLCLPVLTYFVFTVFMKITNMIDGKKLIPFLKEIGKGNR